MINNPTIIDYKPFYIQIGSALYDTMSQWGLIAKSNPYPALATPKKPYSNNWKDENGEDEHNAHLYYESFTFDVEFYIRTKASQTSSVWTDSVQELRAQMAAFFNAIKDGEFMVYDAYTGMGRQKVRYAGFKEKAFKSRGSRNNHTDWATCHFAVTFKVNDPTTFKKLNSNGTAIVDL